MSLPQERSTAEQVFYTWVAVALGVLLVHAFALNKLSSSSSSSSSLLLFTALALNKPSSSSSSSSSYELLGLEDHSMTLDVLATVQSH